MAVHAGRVRGKRPLQHGKPDSRVQADNYELESITGDLVEPEKAKPNLQNLHSAHDAGRQAAQMKKNEYTMK